MYVQSVVGGKLLLGEGQIKPQHFKEELMEVLHNFLDFLINLIKAKQSFKT